MKSVDTFDPDLFDGTLLDVMDEVAPLDPTSLISAADNNIKALGVRRALGRRNL